MFSEAYLIRKYIDFVDALNEVEAFDTVKLFILLMFCPLAKFKMVSKIKSQVEMTKKIPA